MPPWRNGRRDRLKIYCPLRVCQFESDRRYQKQNLFYSQPNHPSLPYFQTLKSLKIISINAKALRPVVVNK